MKSLTDVRVCKNMINTVLMKTDLDPNTHIHDVQSALVCVLSPSEWQRRISKVVTHALNFDVNDFTQISILDEPYDCNYVIVSSSPMTSLESESGNRSLLLDCLVVFEGERRRNYLSHEMRLALRKMEHLSRWLNEKNV